MTALGYQREVWHIHFKEDGLRLDFPNLKKQKFARKICFKKLKWYLGLELCNLYVCSWEMFIWCTAIEGVEPRTESWKLQDTIQSATFTANFLFSTRIKTWWLALTACLDILLAPLSASGRSPQSSLSASSPPDPASGPPSALPSRQVSSCLPTCI